jgi:uncharacterized membrane protein
MTTRAEFLAALRARLHGAPGACIDEVAADYAAHFDEGVAAGRTETDIARGLGDPVELADQLRVELRITEWESRQSPRSAFRLISASIARGAIGIVTVLVGVPLLLALLAALLLGTLGFFAGGIWLLVAGASVGLPGGAGTAWLAGVGSLAAAVAFAALAALIVILLLNWLAGRARADLQLLASSRRTRI